MPLWLRRIFAATLTFALLVAPCLSGSHALAAALHGQGGAVHVEDLQDPHARNGFTRGHLHDSADGSGKETISCRLLCEAWAGRTKPAVFLVGAPSPDTPSADPRAADGISVLACVPPGAHPIGLPNALEDQAFRPVCIYTLTRRLRL